MTIQPEIEKLVAQGVLPSERTHDLEKVRLCESLCRAIRKPLTDSEACALVQALGDDGCFGLASSVIALIETAPGWPIEACLAAAPQTELANELRARAGRG